MKPSLLSAVVVLGLASPPVWADDDAARARVLSPAALAAVLAGYDAFQSGDYAAAVAAWRPYVELAPHRAQFLFARMLAEGRGTETDPAAAAALMNEAAQHGHAEGEYLLGLALRAAGDAAAGIKWLTVAANQNWPDAHYALGQLYEAGEGVEEDLVEALFRYGVAISLGHPLALARAEPLTQRMTPDQIVIANQRIADAAAE